MLSTSVGLYITFVAVLLPSVKLGCSRMFLRQEQGDSGWCRVLRRARLETRIFMMVMVFPSDLAPFEEAGWLHQ